METNGKSSNLSSVMMVFIFMLGALLITACGSAAASFAAIQPTVIAPASANENTTSVATPTNGSASASTTAVGNSAVRICDYIPGKSVPAQMPAGLMANPAPTAAAAPFPFTNTPVDSLITSAQLAIYQQIWDAVNQNYVYSDFSGKDWQAIGQTYQDIINKGLKQEDFYQAMKQMLFDLDSGISIFLSPSEVSAQDNLSGGNSDAVGIVVVTMMYDVNGQKKVVIYAIRPGSPAEKAGLKKHDILLKVDGGPVLDDQGQARTLGKEGTSVTITVQTPGQSPRALTLLRQEVNTQVPVDICLVSGTRIGYIHWLNYQTSDMEVQVNESLQKFGASGALQGLIIDTRGVSDGEVENVLPVFSLFTQGNLANFVSPGKTEPFTIQTPQDVSGSQTIPLVLL